MNSKIIAAMLSISLAYSMSACSNTATESTSAATPATEPTHQISVPQTPEFEDITLVDNDNCTIRITGIQPDNLWGYTLQVFMENKTDLDLMFSANDVSVNGFMCDPFWATTVTAGMKANDEISFSSTSFEANKITDVTEIEMELHVYDTNNWTADRIVDEIFTIYPMGEEAVKPYVRANLSEETVLFDNENCAMIVTGYEPDHPFGYAVHVYLENKTENSLMFSTSDVSVNGYMCDPFWATEIAAGKRSNTTITWSEDSFAENGITIVENVKLPIRVYDADNWNNKDLIADTFTLIPQE